MDSPPPRHGLLAASEAAAATRTARVGCPARLGFEFWLPVNFQLALFIFHF